ncbi:M50 family metallopeptidase [Demequina pelophila]|uniref:M50 family metallopeptidase n=1 Tax=Demequina pelophila TaxID=1638984 RepID=UPI0009E65AC6|nr:M50 family metallopeptidase [Demequina pelophila]
MDLAAIWDRLWADVTMHIYPTLPAVLIPLGVVVAVLAVPALWGVVRHAVTIAHEGGHALVAVLTGRRVSGIRLHSDTSGVTESWGNARRLPLSLVAFAGYPAPAVLGLACAWALSQGWAVGVLWALLVVLLLVLMRIRNWFGFFVMVVAIAGLGAAAWSLPDEWRVGIAYGIAWLLLLGAVRAVLELGASRRRGRGRGSDADALARLTRVPGAVWVGLFWLVTVGCAAFGGWIMVGHIV